MCENKANLQVARKIKNENATEKDKWNFDCDTVSEFVCFFSLFNPNIDWLKIEQKQKWIVTLQWVGWAVNDDDNSFSFTVNVTMLQFSAIAHSSIIFFWQKWCKIFVHAIQWTVLIFMVENHTIQCEHVVIFASSSCVLSILASFRNVC